MKDSQTISLQPNQQDHIIAALTALAIAIHVIESSFPTIIPGVKPGLANIITLLSFFLFGFRVAIQVSLLRVLLSSLILGSFLSPTFYLSFSGALSSLIALGIFHGLVSRFSNYFPRSDSQPWVGPIGYSLVAATFHMLGQFFIAWYLYIPHHQLFKLLPILITISAVLGLSSGILTQYFLSTPKLKSIYQHSS